MHEPRDGDAAQKVRRIMHTGENTGKCKKPGKGRHQLRPRHVHAEKLHDDDGPIHRVIAGKRCIGLMPGEIPDAPVAYKRPSPSPHPADGKGKERCDHDPREGQHAAEPARLPSFPGCKPEEKPVDHKSPVSVACDKVHEQTRLARDGCGFIHLSYDIEIRIHQLPPLLLVASHFSIRRGI